MISDNNMKRVNLLLRHPLFLAGLGRVAEYERDRIFCGHGLEHLLDVARIAYILCLEAGVSVEKEVLYATALLHDIGRLKQYEDGTPHEEESARIAEEILPQCGFVNSEIEIIRDAILSHRTHSGEKPGLAGMLYRADKLSRLCLDCEARGECNWEKKNEGLEY